MPGETTRREQRPDSSRKEILSAIQRTRTSSNMSRENMSKGIVPDNRRNRATGKIPIRLIQTEREPKNPVQAGTKTLQRNAATIAANSHSDSRKLPD